MTIRTRAMWIAGGAFSLVAGGLMWSVGCGGDDTIVVVPPDGSADASVGQDASQGDSGPSDAGNDAQDVNVPDVGPPDLVLFTHQMNAAWCNRFKQCCATVAVPGFDINRCVDNYDNNSAIDGFLGSRPFRDVADGGHFDFDAVQAQKCFQEIAAMPCADITSAQLLQVRNVCFSAIRGNVDAGSPCNGSAECKAPNHCAQIPDAGPDAGSECTAPRGTGVACDQRDQCGQLLTGVPQFCADPLYAYNGDGTCHPQKNLDAGCYFPEECQSYICGDTQDPTLMAAGAGACSASSPLVYKADCEFFVPPDGG